MSTCSFKVLPNSLWLRVPGCHAHFFHITTLHSQKPKLCSHFSCLFSLEFKVKKHLLHFFLSLFGHPLSSSLSACFYFYFLPFNTFSISVQFAFSFPSSPSALLLLHSPLLLSSMCKWRVEGAWDGGKAACRKFFPPLC